MSPMKFNRRLAFVGRVDGHEVIIAHGEFVERLLIIDGKTVGYVKPQYLQGVIERTIKEAKTTKKEGIAHE